MDRISKFCYEHPNFGIRNLMLYITIGNVALWILSMVNYNALSLFWFDPALIMRGQVWRLVTFIIYPPSTRIIAFVMFYFYYWMGSSLEQYWGKAQFNIYFFSGVILTVIYGFLLYFITGISVAVDCQYIYLSMFFAFATLFPDMTVLLFFAIPIKIKYLAYVDAAFFAMSILSAPLPVKLLPILAVANYLIFCGADLFGSLKKYKTSKNTVNFRRESRRIKQEERDKLYNHKCAVCGRTDTDFPELEFRYCSRCAGYHCFCQDHINNHIHFTE